MIFFLRFCQHEIKHSNPIRSKKSCVLKIPLKNIKNVLNWRLRKRLQVAASAARQPHLHTTPTTPATTPADTHLAYLRFIDERTNTWIVRCNVSINTKIIFQNTATLLQLLQNIQMPPTTIKIQFMSDLQQNRTKESIREVISKQILFCKSEVKLNIIWVSNSYNKDIQYTTRQKFMNN